jgi:hypothetical protein
LLHNSEHFLKNFSKLLRVPTSFLYATYVWNKVFNPNKAKFSFLETVEETSWDLVIKEIYGLKTIVKVKQCGMAQYGAAWLSMVPRGSVMVRHGSVGSALACWKAGPSSNLG